MWYSAVGCLVTLTLSFLATPLTAAAPPPGKMPRIGVLALGSPSRFACLEGPAHRRRRSGLTGFAALYLAYVSPYRLLVCPLAETSARLGAGVVR